MDWQTFFPPGTRVMALPNWERPRVYVPADALLGRWRASGFLRAFRPCARAYRLLLRGKAAAALGETRIAQGTTWAFGDFVRSTLPGITCCAVSIGTLAKAQKIAVRLFDAAGNVVAYAKCAGKPAAITRLRHERYILEQLPAGLGPRMLAYGALAGGEVMLLSPVRGRPLGSSPGRSVPLDALLGAMANGPDLPARDHPGLAFAWENSCDVSGWTAALLRRRWRVVIHHGDLAPWNVYAGPNGQVSAIDWEYASLAGFPHLDLAYYALHVFALIQRRSPADAARRSADILCSSGGPSPREARALVALAAYDAYRKALADGDSANEPLQRWQRAIWSTTPSPRAARMTSVTAVSA